MTVDSQSLPLLTLNGVNAAYGAISVLHDVSLEVRTGEIVTLIGSNGAGKTSLLMSLFGQPRCGSGSIIFDGQSLLGLQVHQLAARGICLVPEGRRIFPQMTVFENLQLGSISLRQQPDIALLEEIYILFPILRQRREQRAGTLSGGEQQMLAIGRGLLAKPKLLLLDEPSLGLAPLVVKQIFGALRLIKQRGTTIFLVEQNANHALQLADRGYVLVNGRVTLKGSGAELLSNPEVRQAYLGGQSV